MAWTPFAEADLAAAFGDVAAGGVADELAKADLRPADVGAGAERRKPSWKTMRARSALTCETSPLRVGSVMRFQSERMAWGDWRFSRSQSAKVTPSSSGSGNGRGPGCGEGPGGGGFLGGGERLEAEQRGQEVQGRRQVRGGKDARAPDLVHDGHAQPLLEVGAVANAKALEEADVRGAAAEKDVLAVVDDSAGLFIGVGVGAAAEEGRFSRR